MLMGLMSVPVLADSLTATAVRSDGSTTVTFSEAVTATVIGASYEDGRMTGVKVEELNAGDSVVLNGIEADMVFIWDSLGGIEPLCDPVVPTEAATETPTEAATAAPTEEATAAPTEAATSAPETYDFSIDFTEMTEAKEYSAEAGQGFVEKSSAIMPEGSERQVAPLSEITVSSDGAKVTESGAAYTHAKTNSNDGDDYNYGGMIYRVDTPAGAYHIEVEVTGSAADTRVAPTGMDASRLTGTSNWDNCGNVPRKVYAKWSGSKWSYDFATGEDFVEIEVEPTSLATAASNKTVGVKSIKIIPIAIGAAGDKPTIHIIGDSTQKTYSFNEVISSWGQTLGNYFDSEKVNVINYSMGGRAMKSNYNEGRFDEILINGKAGDFVFIHSAHNDETISKNRFSRGSGTVSGDLDANNAVYNEWLDMYVSAIKARGMIPVLVTAMPRINSATGAYSENASKPNGFNPDSPGNMREKAKTDDGVALAELYEGAKAYLAKLDGKEVAYIYNMVEAGETPADNSANGANGDGTHYREAAAKQFCRIILQSIYDQANAGEDTYTDKAIMAQLVSYMPESVTAAAETGDWSEVFPEVTKDVSAVDVIPGAEKQALDNFYYRTSIEKALQLGLLHKDTEGNFKPTSTITVGEFARGVEKAFGLNDGALINYEKTAKELEGESLSVAAAAEPELRTAAEDVTITVSQPTGGSVTVYNMSKQSTATADVTADITTAEQTVADNAYFTLVSPPNMVSGTDTGASFANADITGSYFEIRLSGSDTAPFKTATYTAKADGKLTAYVRAAQNKELALDNGSSKQTKFVGDGTSTSNIYTAIEFDVTAGQTYTLYISGGTGRLYGVKYEGSDIPSSTTSLTASAGDTIKVVAESDEGYSFDAITVGGEAVGYAKEYTFTADSAVTVSAQFSEKIVGSTAITVVQPEGGTITVYNDSAFNTETVDIKGGITANSTISDNKYFTLIAPPEIVERVDSKGIFADNPAITTSAIEFRNTNPDKHLTYTAKADGILTVYAYFQGSKAIQLVGGTTQTKYVDSNTSVVGSADWAYGAVTFNVEAGKTYTLQAVGGTGRLFGVKYESTDYPQSTEQLMVSNGDTVRVVVVPDSGYVIDYITVDGEKAATGREYIFTAKESVTVSAVLTAEPEIVDTTIVAADAPLTREVMGAILYDAYQLVEDKTNINKYMSQNGGVPTPDDPNYDPNIKYEGSPYIPITGWGALTDKEGLNNSLYAKVKAAYNMGLIRPETGIARGSIALGTELEPTAPVTRAKAAKTLVFAFILTQPTSGESQTVPAGFGMAEAAEIAIPAYGVQPTVYTKAEF